MKNIRMRRWLGAFTVALAVVLVACGGGGDGDDDDDGSHSLPEPTGHLNVSTTEIRRAFDLSPTQACPENVSPALYWGNFSSNTDSFTIVMDDLDAGGFVHWVIYDIPRDVDFFDYGVPLGDVAADYGDAKQGENDFGDIGYGGPCPPEEEIHNYRIRLYSIDRDSGLEPGATWAEVEDAIDDHIIGRGVQTGPYPN